MHDAAILVVDDRPDVHQAIRLALKPHVARLESAFSADALADAMAAGPFDCVLLDMNFAPGDRSGRQGMAALDAIKSADPSVSVVFMTAYGAISLAVESLKRGAQDFILKPWRNDALIAAVRSASERTRANRRGTSLERIERTAIAGALERYDGNIARAAAALGLSRQGLYRRMARHGLDS